MKVIVEKIGWFSYKVSYRKRHYKLAARGEEIWQEDWYHITCIWDRRSRIMKMAEYIASLPEGTYVATKPVIKTFD